MTETKKESDKQRFIRVAKELECDESGKEFMQNMETIVTAKPITNEEIKNKKQ